MVLRKLALALIGVFGASLGDMQVHITLALCVLNLLATAVFQPFGGKSAHVLQKFELLSLLALFLTLWSGSVFNSKPKCVGEQGEVVAWCSVLSVCVGVFDIMVVLGIGLALGFVMRKTKDSSKKEKEGKDSTANVENPLRVENPGNDDRRQKDQQVAIELANVAVAITIQNDETKSTKSTKSTKPKKKKRKKKEVEDKKEKKDKKDKKEKKGLMDEEHRRTSTELPEGWSKLKTSGGKKYYAHAKDQLSRWTPPPGSKGSSAEKDEL